MDYNEICRTVEMPLWTGEEAAPDAPWGVYTALGPFIPYANRVKQMVPYAQRVEHVARHNLRLGWRNLRRVAVNVWRESGEFLVGAFQPIRDAI